MPKKIIILVCFLLISIPVLAADTTPPSSTLTKDPLFPNGNNGWYTSPVLFDLSATDLDSGIKSINYKIDNNEWTTIQYEDTLNLAPNPSLEDGGTTPPLNVESWEANLTDSFTTYSRDTTYAKDDTYSVNITSSSAGWHSIDHHGDFSVAESLNNMSASVWIKGSSINGEAYFIIYAIHNDAGGNPTTTKIKESDYITSNTDWTQLEENFVVNVENALGVYMEVGLDGTGSIWIDAVNISESIISSSTQFSVGSDGYHTVSYYSKDQAGNTEATRSTDFKIDQTPPGNWHNSGAFRGFIGPSYHLWVYTNVEDETSGLSTFTDKYQYYTELNSTYGHFDNILNCSSEWEPDEWIILISPPFWPGSKSVYLLTPKTSFCNSNWNICKMVRFFARDMAGNTSTKEFCINGPWIKLRGKGITRGENGIDMLSEADGDNSDGLIESGNNQVDFFTSSKDWEAKNSIGPEDVSYEYIFEYTGDKDDLGDGLTASSGLFYKNGDLTISADDLPSNFVSENFNQIIFIDGDLTIETDIIKSNESTLLFIVSGDVKIDMNVLELNCGIITDQKVYTAYNLPEGDASEALTLKGFYIADRFYFQRTLQGVDNNDTPSEDFTYEPKYITNLEDYLGKSKVRWISSN